MNVEFFINLFFSGLTRGSIYALLALGYTMVYGIIKLINFAHGEIYMIGAFTALIMTSVFTILNIPVAAIIALVALISIVWSAMYGYTIEKVAYKPLRKAPRLSALISAIGMSLFLQNYVRLAQTSDFLPFPRNLPTFGFLDDISGLPSSQLIIFITTAIVMVALTILIKFTRIGKAMRATAQDRTMAMLSGVNINRVIAITFIIGSATAAIGGVLTSSHIGQINFYIGFLAGIKAFVAGCWAASAASRELFSGVSSLD